METVQKKNSQMDIIRKKLGAIRVLRLLKNQYTYKEISRMLNLPIPVISRYVKGHVLPKEDRAEQILNIIKKEINLRSLLKSRIIFDNSGYFDNTKILSDINLLRMITEDILSEIGIKKVDKVLTAAVDGISFATLFADELGVNLIYAKKDKEVGVQQYFEESFILQESGIRISYYLPKNAIKPGEKILIVDDIIRSGETQRALVNLVLKAKAKVVQTIILISIGNAWKKNWDPGHSIYTYLSIECPERY